MTAAAMLDWVSGLIPCRHPHPIDGGRVLKIDRNGVKEWETATRLEVAGSYDAKLAIRTYQVDDRGIGTMLELSGNPTKFLQGHNLFGACTRPGPLMDAVMQRLLQMMPVPLTPDDFDRWRWRNAAIELTRVDVNRMYALGSRSDVRAWLRSAEHSAYLKHRGRGQLTKNGTLYFGKNSRRWSLKFYSKGDELEAGKGHGLPDGILHADKLGDWSDDKLRGELTLRSMELKRRQLRLAINWTETTADELLDEALRGLQMSDKHVLPAPLLEGLPPRLRMAYEAWTNGVDMRVVLPARTFYRYRKQLLPHGVDLAIRQPHEDRSNVVPLIRVLEAVPAEPPEWARGTELLWEPPPERPNRVVSLVYKRPS